MSARQRANACSNSILDTDYDPEWLTSAIKRLPPSARLGENIVMEICTNKNTGQTFIHLDVEDKNQALMITPQGVVKALQYDLFTEPVDVEDAEALEKGGINSAQYAIYNQYSQNLDNQ